MIFQDPYASLNARMTVSDIIGEPLDIHHLKAGKEREEFILELLDRVGLNKDHASRYPHEFREVSGREWELPALWRSIRSLSSAMSQSLRWTFPFRHRSLT